MAKTPIDRLESEISKILEEYGEEVDQYVDEAIVKVSKSGQKALKANSRQQFRGSGEYAKGWSVKVEKGRIGNATATLYNKKPGLPHLLEHGHAKRNGGRVRGREHIAPVEAQIAEQFEKELEGLL